MSNPFQGRRKLSYVREFIRSVNTVLLDESHLSHFPCRADLFMCCLLRIHRARFVHAADLKLLLCMDWILSCSLYEFQLDQVYRCACEALRTYMSGIVLHCWIWAYSARIRWCFNPQILHLSHISTPVSITLELRGYVDRGTFCELCEFATSRTGAERVKNEQKRRSIFKTRQIRSNRDQQKSRRHVEQQCRNACEKAAWDFLL